LGLIGREGFTQIRTGCTRMHADGMRLNELSRHVVGPRCLWAADFDALLLACIRLDPRKNLVAGIRTILRA